MKTNNVVLRQNLPNRFYEGCQIKEHLPLLRTNHPRPADTNRHTLLLWTRRKFGRRYLPLGNSLLSFGYWLLRRIRCRLRPLLLCSPIPLPRRYPLSWLSKSVLLGRCIRLLHRLLTLYHIHTLLLSLFFPVLLFR